MKTLEESIDDFGKRLNELIGYDSKKPSSNQIAINDPVFNPTSECKKLIEGQFYIYIPYQPEVQERVKAEILKYTNKNKLKFVVTTTRYCFDDHECGGHVVDPLQVKYKEHIFQNQFPENINGAHVYFFTKKGFSKYKNFLEAKTK